MLRLTILLRLHFASTVASEVQQSSARGKRQRRSFIASESSRKDPHTIGHSNSNNPPATSSLIHSRGLSRTVSDNSDSQRGRWRKFVNEQRDPSDPVEALSGMTSKIHQTLPADMIESPRLSRADEKRKRLQEILRESSVSTLDITEGGELDIDYGGMPTEAFHAQSRWTAIPEESALYQNILNKDAMESRSASNSWKVVGALNKALDSTSTDEEVLMSKAGSEGLWKQHNGMYRQAFSGDISLDPVDQTIAHSRSTYALRKLFLPGLLGYIGMITEAEEVKIADEVISLTQSRSATYVAEESRYCVNLFEDRLGLPRGQALALPISSCPTLASVLSRFVDLKLIPCSPNTVQISEFIGTFSGYPPHRKPPSVGPYVGLLNLVSTGVLHMRHCDFPWAPRVAMQPRSLFVFENPCLGEYSFGYSATHQPFHNFDYATRLAKDYRIEILFACVEVENSRLLNHATALTDYAINSNKKELLGTTVDQVHSTDQIIENLKNVQAKAAQESLNGRLGSPKEPKVSPRARIAELKARHNLIRRDESKK